MMGITVFGCLIVIVAYVVVSFVGAYTIKWLLGSYYKSVEKSGLKGAGMIIGIFERMLVLTFIIFNFFWSRSLLPNNKFGGR